MVGPVSARLGGAGSQGKGDPGVGEREEWGWRLKPTCQENNVCLLQGGTAVLPDVQGVVSAQQPPCHPAQEAGDTQSLHGSPAGPGKQK